MDASFVPFVLFPWKPWKLVWSWFNGWRTLALPSRLLEKQDMLTLEPQGSKTFRQRTRGVHSDMWDMWDMCYHMCLKVILCDSYPHETVRIIRISFSSSFLVEAKKWRNAPVGICLQINDMAPKQLTRSHSTAQMCCVKIGHQVLLDGYTIHLDFLPCSPSSDLRLRLAR